MKKQKIAFHTLGCKLNFAESSTLARQYRDNGYETVNHKEEADIYVIHSCAVTAQAESKCRAAIRQAKKRNPDSKVAVIGCYPQLKEEEINSMEEADIVLGNTEKHLLFDYLNENDSKFSQVSNIQQSHSCTPAYSSGDRTRSFLKIQDGCDYYCSYCTIPYARGKSRSLRISDILKSTKEIASLDIKEIILTGVNIGDYGKPNNENLYELLKELIKINGIERIRISSIEPDLLTDEIIHLVAESKKLMPHFHIPLQAGSDRILKLMRRKYKRDVFAKKVSLIKKIMPFACIAADIIVGFPGETDDDFNDSFSFIDSLPISYLHVFSYSERPGTKAAQLTDKVHPGIKKDRSKKLHELSDKKKHEFYKKNSGKSVDVLFESTNHSGYIQGFSDNYIRVKKVFNRSLINDIQTVNLIEIDNDNIYKTD